MLAFITALEKYLSHLKYEKRLANNTHDSYRRDLQQLNKFLLNSDIKEISAVDTNILKKFSFHLHQQQLKPKSIRRKLAAIKGFFAFLEHHQLIDNNPAKNLIAPKAGKYLPKVIDADAAQQLLQAPNQEPLTIRDFAIMELLYGAGLRLHEVTSVNIKDIDFNANTVKVTGKGGKHRMVFFGNLAATALQKWMKFRNLWHSDSPALFISKSGNRISDRNVQKRLQLWGKKQGIDINIHPHLLRHAFASHLLESSGELLAVQELLGHSNLSTTEIYTKLDFQHLASVYDKCHPRDKKK